MRIPFLAALLTDGLTCLAGLTLTACVNVELPSLLSSSTKEEDDKSALCTVRETREQFYKDGEKPYSTSNVTRLFRGGRLEKRFEGGNPGADKRWETDDDTVVHSYTVHYDADGNPDLVEHYSSFGTSSVENTFDAQGRRTSFVQKSGDAAEMANKTYSYEAEGPVRIYHIEPPVGPRVTDFVYAEGKRVAIIERGPEHEGEEPVSWQILRYDEDGKLVASERYEGAGSDAVWGTGDDQVQSHKRIQYDSFARVVTETTFGGPGGDDKWLTEDDVVSSTLENTFKGTRRIGVADRFDGGRFISTFAFDCPSKDPEVVSAGPEWFEGGGIAP